MPNHLNDINGDFSIMHQAICQEGDFTGDPRSDINEAFEDANRHNEEPGCEFHLIKIVHHHQTVSQFISPRIHEILLNRKMIDDAEKKLDSC